MPYREQAAFLNKYSILRNPSFSMPIGLIDLSAYLRIQIKEIDIKILDIGKDLYKVYMNRETTPPMSVESFIDSELDTIDFKPDIVGISILFSTAHITSMKIADKVKKRWDKAIVVCGGNHATNCVQSLLSNPNIDYVLRGEGEIPSSEFIKKVQDGEENIDVFGLIDRSKLKINPEQLAPLIKNLDEIPMPAYDLLDIETYKKTVGASIIFSRGCIFQCTFCAVHTVYGNKIRHKSNDRIMKELIYLVKEYNLDTIVIEDDLFAVNKSKFLDLADRIVNLKIPLKFYLPQGFSVAVLDEEIIDAMIGIGIDEGAVAIESGSSYTQKYIIKKNLSLAKARRVLGYLRKKDFLIYVNFIFGFFGETRELMQETIDFIKALDVDWVYIFHALPLPGSEMFKQFASAGVIDPNNFDWDGIRLGRRTFDTSDITAEELERLVYDTNINCNFFNNANIKHGRYKRAIDVLTRLIIAPYPFHVVGYYCRALAYLGINNKKEADADFKECVRWIGMNAESKRLFDRYGEKMPYLKPHLKENRLSSVK